MTRTLTNRNDVECVADDVRKFLQECWQHSKEQQGRTGEPIAQGMCKVSTLFLKEVLRESFPGHGWRAKGGLADPDPMDDSLLVQARTHRIPGGFFDGQHWNDHVWLQGDCAHGPVIVDVTADQFGSQPAVIVEDASSARYRANRRDLNVFDELDVISYRIETWREWWHEHKACLTL